MKKRVSILLMVVSLLLANPGFAQTYYGIKTGVNINKANDNELTESFSSKNNSGFFIGPMLEAQLPIGGFAFNGALLYSQRSSKFSYHNVAGLTDETTVKQHAFEIPVNLKWSIGLGNLLSLFVATGPDFIFNLKNDNMLQELSQLANPGQELSIKNKTKKAEMAWNVGVGVNLIQFFQVGLTYNIPLTNNVAGDIENIPNWDTIFTDKNFKTKNRTWQLSLAILF